MLVAPFLHLMALRLRVCGTGDSAAKLTISSPLEAHKSHTLVLDTCGVDVGFDNPIFACLEVWCLCSCGYVNRLINP